MSQIITKLTKTIKIVGFALNIGAASGANLLFVYLFSPLASATPYRSVMPFAVLIVGMLFGALSSIAAGAFGLLALRVSGRKTKIGKLSLRLAASVTAVSFVVVPTLILAMDKVVPRCSQHTI